MFTGIIEAVGTVKGRTLHETDLSLEIDMGDLDLGDVVIGDSIAVTGVCLTVIRMTGKVLQFDVSMETVSRSLLGELATGSRVNLEKALAASARLGGHLVSGHVDGLGELVACVPDGRSTRMQFCIPSSLGKYVAAKGSITIDGISLTVNDVTDAREGTLFGVNLVPHTLAVTTLGELAPGRQVHIEVDIIARYLERLVQPQATDD